MQILNETGGHLDVIGTTGRDVAFTVVAVVDETGGPFALTGAAITFAAYTPGTETVVQQFAVGAIQGAGSNVFTLKLTAAQTSSLGVDEWPVAMTVTKDGLTSAWTFGRLRLTSPGFGLDTYQ